MAATTLKHWIDRESKTYSETASEARLRAFAHAVRAPSSADLPTFFTCWRAGEFELLDRMGIQLKQVLHGEQEYEFLAPIATGATVEFRTRLKDCMEKQGRGYALHFLVFETDFRQSGGERLAYARSTIIFREPIAEEAGK